MKHSILAILVTHLALLGACSKHKDDHAGHSHAETKTDATAPANDHHGGKVIDLGAAPAGPFQLATTRDDGLIAAGGDAPIDVRVTGGAVKAVRFWIGLESAVGSVKALAAIEDPAEPNRWHTHAEVPNPIPDGTKLWVEVEAEDGAKHLAGFDLKR